MNITEFARLGGKARAKKLSKERLSAIARKAGKASGKARRACKQVKCQAAKNGENKVKFST